MGAPAISPLKRESNPSLGAKNKTLALHEIIEGGGITNQRSGFQNEAKDASWCEATISGDDPGSRSLEPQPDEESNDSTGMALVLTSREKAGGQETKSPEGKGWPKKRGKGAGMSRFGDNSTKRKGDRVEVQEPVINWGKAKSDGKG